MKSNILFIICLFGATALAAQPEKPVDSKITNVTVFLNRAQISRDVKCSVDAGKTNLIITGLTSQLDPESIQVSGKGSITILGIGHRQNFLTEQNQPKAIRVLKDSITLLQQQIAFEQSQKETLNKEEQMLVSNQKIGGTNQNLTVAELRAMADFYRSRLGDIVTARMKEDERIKKTNERIVKLTMQLNSQNELYTRNTSEIVVSVSADVASNVSLALSYVVPEAGWNAVFDLRATTTKNPIQLMYKANVFQSTGEDWKNVRLTLSTANPSQSGLKPELDPWYLNLEQPAPRAVYYKSRKMESMLSGKVAGVAVNASAPEAEMDKDAKSSSEYVSTVQTSVNTEFDISLPYTVASSAKPTVVEIRNYEMKADYIYSVAPKLDNDAFLVARVTGWEEYSLIPGEANLFFEGTFVGKTYLDPNTTRDTLSVSLGRDRRISVKREKVKDLSSRKLIGTNQRESSAWEITVRNNKAESVRIVVEDQIPVSQDSQVEVTATDTGGAKYNKDSGKLAWDLSLQPSASKKLTFKYEVKYPKDKIVTGL